MHVRTINKKLLSVATAAIFLVAAQVAAQDATQPAKQTQDEQQQQKRAPQAENSRETGQQRQSPLAKPDDSFITISGTVKSVAPDGFALNYGDGLLTIEMDSPRGESGYAVVIGDKVTVTGVIDDDLFERRSVDASSVYIDRLGTRFFAPGAIDEKDVIATAVVTPIPVVEARTVVAGTVTAVTDGEFTVNTGGRRVKVDTSRLAEDPLERIGPSRLEVGERVGVLGEMDSSFFEGRRLMAESIVVLSSL